MTRRHAAGHGAGCGMNAHMEPEKELSNEVTGKEQGLIADVRWEQSEGGTRWEPSSGDL